MTLPGGFGGTRTLVRLLAATAGWALAVFASSKIALAGKAHDVALFVHAMAFVFGFGTVLAVMFCGLRVVLGKMTFAAASRTAVVVDPGIWIGYGFLVLSGAFLHGDLSSSWMRAKLGLSLLVCLNGILALPSMQSLLKIPEGGGLESVPKPLRMQVLAQTTISQLTWWSTIMISFFAMRFR